MVGVWCVWIAAGFILAGIVFNSVGHFALSYSRCIWLELVCLFWCLYWFVTAVYYWLFVWVVWVLGLYCCCLFVVVVITFGVIFVVACGLGGFAL